MKRRLTIVATWAALLVGGSLLPSCDATPGRNGYLGSARPDHLASLPPPPSDDSPRGAADVAVFRATRALEDGPRWTLAARDDQVGQKALLHDYACALGVDLSTLETPALSRVITRASADLFPIVGAAKDHYGRPRPFVAEQRPICIAPSEDFARSGSYPSGHAAAGWLYALLLRQVDPQHETQIMARGRAFGESRVVCGVHYVSDIEAGRSMSESLFQALQGNREFEADLDAARAEFAKLRATSSPPATSSCAADAALLDTPY